MSLVVLSRNLIVIAPLLAAAARVDQAVRVTGDPANLAQDGRPQAVVVDWDDREPTWGHIIRDWLDRSGPRPPRVVLFGPHLDRTAHTEARRFGLGPVLPRSRMVAEIEALLASMSSPR